MITPSAERENKMPIREEMRNLTEDIIHSYEDRSARIAGLRQTVKGDLKNMRIDLAKSDASRKESVGTLLKDMSDAHTAMSGELKAGLTGGTANLRRDITNMLEGLVVARQAINKAMKADLAEGIAERKQEVDDLLKEVDAMLKSFAQNRDTANKQMKADLAKGSTERKQEVDTLLKDVEAMLKGFDKNHNTMTRQMKADLAKGSAERKRNVDILINDSHVMLKGFEVKLHEIRTALEGGRDEWQRMATTLQSMRGAAVSDVKPQKEASIPTSAIQVADLTPKLAAFRDRVFEYLANHPDGTRLVNLEQEFGMARIQMAKITRSLISKNKVEKRDSLYFAI